MNHRVTGKIKAIQISENERKKERSVMTGFLFGFFSLFPFLYIMILSNSIVLLAEAFRSGNETLACLLSWITLVQIHRHPGKYPNMERYAGYFTGAVLCLSFMVVLFNAYQRFLNPGPITFTGGLLGVGAAILAGSANLWFWLKNRKIAAKEVSAVMESQWRLFRAKFVANCTVLVSLSVSLIFAKSSGVVYVDPVFSIFLGSFMLYSAFNVFFKS